MSYIVAKITAWASSVAGYLIAAGAAVIAILGIIAKISADGKARGIAKEREAARKRTDKAVKERHEIDNDINAGSGSDARDRLRNDWRRD